MSLKDLSDEQLSEIKKRLNKNKKLENKRIERLDYINIEQCKQSCSNLGTCFDGFIIDRNMLKKIYSEVMQDFQCICYDSKNICENCERRGYTFKFSNFYSDESIVAVIELYIKNNVTFHWIQSKWHMTFHKKSIDRVNQKIYKYDIIHITDSNRCKFCINCDNITPILQKGNSFQPIFSNDVPENVLQLFFFYLKMHQSIQEIQNEYRKTKREMILSKQEKMMTDIIDYYQEQKQLEIKKRQINRFENINLVKCFDFQNFSEIEEVYKQILTKIGCTCQDSTLCSHCSEENIYFNLKKKLESLDQIIDRSEKDIEIIAVLSIYYREKKTWNESDYAVIFVRGSADILYRRGELIPAKFSCEKSIPKLTEINQSKDNNYIDIKMRFELYKFYTLMIEKSRKGN